MIPCRLQLSGFLSYVEDDIDFRGLDSITLIRGINSEASSGDEDNNGSGKSGLLDAMEWCLYGRIRGVFNKELVKDDIIHLYEDGSRARKARVSYTFEMDEGYYRVMREKAHQGPSALEVKFSKDLKKWENLTLAAGINRRTGKKETSLKRTQQKIEDILNATCELFINSAFFEQQNTNTFATSTAGDKSDLFKNALYLDKWHDYAAVQKLKLADVESEIRSIDSVLKGKSVDGIKSAIAEVEELNEGIEAEILVYEKSILFGQRHRDGLVKQIAEAEVKEKLQQSTHEQFHQAEKDLRTLRSSKEKLTQKLVNLDNEVRDYKHQIVEVDIDRDIQVLEVEELLLKFRDIHLDNYDYDGERCDLVDEIAGLKGEKKAIEREKDNFKGDCPLMASSCSRGSEEAHETKIAHINKKIFKINKKVAMKQRDLKNVFEIPQKKQRESWALHQKLNDQIDHARGRQKFFEDHIKNTGIHLGLTEKQLVEAQEALASLPDLKKAVKKHADLKIEFDRLDKIDIFDLGIELTESEKVLKGENARLEAEKTALVKNGENIKLLSSKIDKIAGLQASVNELNDRKQKLAYAIKMLGKAIPHQLIELALPDIEGYAQEYISDLSLGRMNIELKATRDISKKDKDTKENLQKDEINMELETDGVVKKYGLCSGGEKTRGDLAIHFGIATFMLNRSGAKIRSMFLDEVSMALDTTGKKALVKLLRRLIDEVGFKKLFVISQDEKFNKLFDCVLTVKKTSEGSKVCLS